MPSTVDQPDKAAIIHGLARKKLLSGILFGENGADDFSMLTGRALGRFSLCVVGLQGTNPSMADIFEFLSGTPQCSGADLFSTAFDRIVLFAELDGQTGYVCNFGELQSLLTMKFGEGAEIDAEPAQGTGAEGLRLCYRCCDRILCDRQGPARIKAGSPGKPATGGVKPVLSKALDYITEHFCEQITLEDVAKHAYASPCYISRLFRREIGVGFVDYVASLRMEKAKQLLGNTKLMVFEISEMAGIPDAHYFSKQFRKQTGLSPTEYREGKWS